MTTEQAIRLMQITHRKTDELFGELIAELQRTGSDAIEQAPPPRTLLTQEEFDSWEKLPPIALPEGYGPLPTGEADPTVRAAGQDRSKPWSLEDAAPHGGWEELERSRTETYTWPDGNLDRYAELVSYRGTGGHTGMTLALGYLDNGDVVGFVLGTGGGSKRGITYFFPADDFERTNETVSMIRGGGPNGRSGFAPGESLPDAYAGLATDVLRDRKAGKWNVQAVVAKADDVSSMLAHTTLQAKLRGLA